MELKHKYIKLLISECELLLNPLNLRDQLPLVEGLFSHNLPAQVLNLGIEPFFDGAVFLAHDFSPDGVQVV